VRGGSTPPPAVTTTNKLSPPEKAGDATEPWGDRPNFHTLIVVGFVIFMLAACLGYPVGF
jgi:hypothetical protein